ncbi:MAG TPA: sigma-70 family RNA polymerase sigma factor [Longimicrobiales bacterium]|nr:sigma-70 family RNA polymerase sigma factor [Longimicrobiales bacterium]
MEWEELFDRHHAGLFRFVARMTGDAEQAKDIVQDTFIRIAGKPAPPGVPPDAWLFGIAQNLTRTALRRRRRRLVLLSGRVHGVPRPAEPTRPDDNAAQAELRADVRAALARLSERERSILLMREEGFRHREIAAALGTTTSSVGTMIARALAKLEGHLGTKWRDAP